MAKLISRKEAFELCPALLKGVYYWQKAVYDDIEEEDLRFYTESEKQDVLACYDLVGLNNISTDCKGVFVAYNGYAGFETDLETLVTGITNFIVELERETLCFATEVVGEWMTDEDLLRPNVGYTYSFLEGLGIIRNPESAVAVSPDELRIMVKF